DDAALIERELRRAGITGAARRVDSEPAYREALQTFAPDIILTDHSLPTFGAADALRIALLAAPDTPVIVVTGSLDEETAAEYIKAGAADYVVKHHLERVGPAVLRALDLRRAQAEQARAEEARRQGEERFRALIEHGADVVALVAPDGTLLFASHSIERLLGFAPAELVGRPAFERVHPDDLPRINAALRDIVASPGTPAGLELRWRHKDGSWRHIDAVAVDRLAEPAVGAIVVNFRDVSERRTAEAALRESEERYRTLVEGVRDIIFALSPEGTIASLNPAFETIAGWRREEWVGRPFERLVHPEDLPLALELLGLGRPPPRGPGRHRPPSPGRRRDPQGRRSRRRTDAPAAGVQPPAGAAADGARGQQAGLGPREDAAPAPGRRRRAQHAARTHHGAGQGRSRSARASGHEPGRERARRDAERGQAHAGDRQRGFGRTVRRRPLPGPRGPVRDARGLGHRHRDERRNPGPHVRAVLHDQGEGQRHGSGARHRLRHHQAEWRIHLGVQRG